MVKDLKVAVWMITYNHQNFIEKAVESAMEQSTSFDFNLFIGEDCSTDKTREICIRLQEKYPDRITLLMSHKNNMALNAMNVYHACIESGAKYIAFLDGDDFWGDKNKLQLQFDFLESNPDYALTYHDCIVVNSHGELINNSKKGLLRRDLSSIELFEGKMIPTVTAFMRIESVSSFFLTHIKDIPNGDTFLFASAGQFGGAHYHTDINPASYRIHNRGVWSSLSDDKKVPGVISTYQLLADFLDRRNRKYAFKVLSHKHAQLAKMNFDTSRVQFSRAAWNSLVFGLKSLKLRYFMSIFKYILFTYRMEKANSRSKAS